VVRGLGLHVVAKLGVDIQGLGLGIEILSTINVMTSLKDDIFVRYRLLVKVSKKISQITTC
jgi:hypothetical protein